MKQKINCDDFLRNRILTNLKVNKSKTRGLYFINTLNLENNCYEKQLAIFDLEDSKAKTMRLSIKPDDFEFYGDEVIFKVYEGKNTKLYHYDFNTDKITLYAEIPYKIKNFIYCNEGFYFTATYRSVYDDEIIKSGTELPFYQEGIGFCAESRTCLFKTDSKGFEIKALTDFHTDIDDIVFDLQNNRIIYTAFKGQPCKAIASDVYTYDLASKSITKWTDSNYRISYVDILSSDELIFAGVDLRVKSRNDNQQLYKINVLTGVYDALGKPLDRSNEDPGVVTDIRFSTSRQVMAVKGIFYFLLVDRYQITLNQIDNKGNLKTYETDLRTIDSYQVLEEGVLLIGLKGLGLHELYLLKDNQLTQVTNYNDWLLKERYVSEPQLIKSYDGDIEIDGWVFPPVDFEPGKKYPGVLMIHGGPKMIYTDVYSHDIQLLTANGYYVFYANPKGSDGRGDDFANIRGSYGATAYKELMDFTDAVIDKYPQLDKDYLGVTGRSYGGYMTNYIITRTDRFKAAISESGISNLTTSFTSSDIGYNYIFEYMGNKTTPWTSNEYLEASPIMNANHVKTPTLFIHGEQDHRCNYTESLNMYSALNFHGISTKLCLFEGENHGLNVTGKPKSKKIRYKEILSWFDKFLKKGKSHGHY